MGSSPCVTALVRVQQDSELVPRDERLRTTRRSTGGAARGGGTPCATSRAWWWSACCWRRTFCSQKTSGEMSVICSLSASLPQGSPSPLLAGLFRALALRRTKRAGRSCEHGDHLRLALHPSNCARGVASARTLRAVASARTLTQNPPDKRHTFSITFLFVWLFDSGGALN